MNLIKRLLNILVLLGIALMMIFPFSQYKNMFKLKGEPPGAEGDLLDDYELIKYPLSDDGLEENRDNLEENGNNSEQDAQEQITSGPVEALPWENDAEFIKAKEQNNTPILMSAYRTVLRDPLPGEEYNVHLAARLLAGRIIKPGQIFSQNDQIGPYNTAKGFREGPTYIGSKLVTTIGGGVCKIASTLYNVVIQSNLQIIQRRYHSMPVPYVPYGQDATVSYGVHDIRFKNDTSSPILIWAEGIDNVLYIAFYGKDKPPEVEWHHEFLKIEKAPIIYKRNPEIPPGTEKVVLEGMDGAAVKSWVTIKSHDGTVTVKRLGMSYYKPMPHIIERSY